MVQRCKGDRLRNDHSHHMIHKTWKTMGGGGGGGLCLSVANVIVKSSVEKGCYPSVLYHHYYSLPFDSEQIKLQWVTFPQTNDLPLRAKAT